MKQQKKEEQNNENKENHKLIFDNSTRNNTIRLKNEKFVIDDSEHKFHIEPDHFYSDKNTIYVVDSKYYNEITDLNYKQFAYTILFGNGKLERNK